MLAPAEVRARKAQCFSSPWWPLTREPDLLDDEGQLVQRGRPIRQVLVARGELEIMAFAGSVDLGPLGKVTVA